MEDGALNQIEILRKRLLHRSLYCGMQENDILLGAFARENLSKMTVPQLEAYEELLNVEDPLLFKWLARKEPVPTAYDTEVMQMILGFLDTKKGSALV
ncbi:MAG: succinate dehydrogenase assembly factor 2 [Alphaproteobacteria bacterium]